MKYLFLILIFLVAVYFFTVLNFYDNGWQYVQPFLVATLLVYYNISNHWIYYAFAFLAGLFVDSFTGVFGLHTIIFLFIIFILRSLQLTLLTSKNILTIILLTILAFVIFWLLFYSANFMFSWEMYTWQQSMLLPIFKMFIVNITAVIFFHLLYFNLHTKKYERQSF
jgi:cell shape-determining protein MreD